ncbi:MAG: hypothetical protein ACLUKN_07795 [Bacilli bacterium]
MAKLLDPTRTYNESQVTTPMNIRATLWATSTAVADRFRVWNQGNVTNIRAFVPLETMFGYATDIRSLSSAALVFNGVSHFEQVPQTF